MKRARDRQPPESKSTVSRTAALASRTEAQAELLGMPMRNAPARSGAPLVRSIPLVTTQGKQTHAGAVDRQERAAWQDVPVNQTSKAGKTVLLVRKVLTNPAMRNR